MQIIFSIYLTASLNEFQLENSDTLGDLKSAIGKQTGKENKDLHLFYHDGGSEIEFGDDLTLVEVFGEDDHVKVDFETQDSAQVPITNNGKCRFLVRQKIDEGTTDSIDLQSEKVHFLKKLSCIVSFYFSILTFFFY